MSFNKLLGTWIYVAVAGAMAILAWCGWWYWGARFIAERLKSAPQSSVGLPELGQTGDLFGGFGALVSALALVGIVYASYLQWQQLKHSRDEATEAKASANADRERARVQHGRQTFESLFFQLIGLLRSQTRSMQIDVSSLFQNTGERIEHFDGALNTIRRALIHWFKTSITPPQPGLMYEILVDRYNMLYISNESKFGPYFRTIFHIFKLIETSELSADAKIGYADILRAQLSRDETFLIMVNCMTPRGDGLKVLVEIYGLLKHVTRRSDDGDAPDEEIARDNFSPTAMMSWLKRERFWAEGNPRPQFRPFEQ